MKGFTLIEVLLSIATITIIAGISVPVYQSLQVRNDLELTAATVAQSARRAELLAEASDGDSSWGLRIQSNLIVIFKGTNYAARDPSVDEVFDVPKSITPSGASEIVFSKFTGLPQTATSVTLTSNANETRTITINAKGMVAY